MKKRFHKKIALSIVIMLLFTIFNPISVSAATLAEKYKDGIRVKFSSMGNIGNLNFSLTDSYYINQSKKLLLSGNYRIECQNGILVLYKDGSKIYSTSGSITIVPLKFGSFIKFVKEIYTRNFSGSISFYKNDASTFYIVNKLSFNDYLKGVVPYEEGDSFPSEALKAQAVAARTYAMFHLGGTTFDVYDTTASQVYRGYSSASTASNAAVNSTKGQVMTYNGSVINAFFSSSNGGWTELPQYAWYPNGSSLPYLTKVQQDIYDHKFKYTFTINDINNGSNDILYRLKNKIAENKDSVYKDLDVKSITDISVTYDTIITHFADKLTINYKDSLDQDQSLTLERSDVKSLLGLIGSYYTFDKQDGKYTFVSRYGHGIGMSQWGSYYRAKAGQSYKTILNFYFQNIGYTNVNTPVNILSYDKRIGGDSRYSTSALIAGNINSGTLSSVIITTGANYPDALAAAPLAGKLGCPILLVNSNPDSEGSKPALNYISSHLSKSGCVYIIGGTPSVPDSFRKKLNSMGYSNISRVYGSDRIETSAAIANKVGSGSKTVMIVRADNFPDGVSVSSIAALYKWPILLSFKNGLSAAAEKYLSVNKPSKVYIIGSTDALSSNVASQVKSITGNTPVRFGGSDRYETSRLIANAFIQNPNELVFTTGKNFPDALTASVYASKNMGTVMLIDNNAKSSAYNYVKSIGSNDSQSKFAIIGSSASISDSTVSYLKGIK